MKRKLLSLFTIAFIFTLLVSSPVYAIANPDDIAFGSGTTSQYAVFKNVDETGDWLILAEGLVEYTVTPTDYTASEAYLFEILGTDGVTTLFSKALNAWGNRPISIYLTAAQVTAAGLVSGSAYVLRISGNPLVFPSLTGNSVIATLTAADYIDQSVGATSDSPTDNSLRNFCILVAENIEAYDTPVSSYLDEIQGYSYLTNSGADIFIEGIPNLYNFCPILFQYGAERVNADVPSSTGSYAAVLTPLDKWGVTVANGLTNIGVYLGINQALAGSVVLFVLVAMLAVYIYNKTQSGLASLVMVASTPFIGGFLGLMPIALAFIFTIVIIILMGYYFFSRGAL
jgi:hypothetical protein